MRRGVVLVLLCSGCQLAFPFEPEVVSDGSCSSMAMITDDFEDGLLVPWWESEDFGTSNAVSESQGKLRLQMHGGGNAMATTSAFFDLRGQASSVEVAVTPGLAELEPLTFVEFALGAPNFDIDAGIQGDAIAFRLVVDVASILLVAGRHESGQFLPVRTVDHDPAKHRFWRLAQSGTTTSWSVSADGETFEELTTTDLQQVQSWAVGHVRPRLYAYSAGTSFEVELDDFNGGGVPPGQACPAASLREAFDGPTLDDDLWRVSQQYGCTLAQEGGALVARFAQDVGGRCEIGSAPVVDLLDSSYTVEVTPGARDQGYASVWVRSLDGSNGYLDQKPTELVAGSERPELTSDYATLPYDGTSPRWLRLRGERADSGEHVLVYETSSDGKTFDRVSDTRDLQGLDRVQLYMGIGNGPTTDPAAVRFDQVNIPP